MVRAEAVAALAAIVRLGWAGVNVGLAPRQDSGGGGAGAHSRWGHSGFVYRERIDLRAFVSCALSFSVGGSLRLPILAGGIFLRSRLRHPRGRTRGRWFILGAEQALEESHLDTSA